MLPRRHSKLLLGALVGLSLGACQAVAGLEDRTLAPDVPKHCQDYCDTVMEVCTGENSVYTTMELCLGVCAHLDPGEPIEPAGNTVACRMREAKSAVREPEDHCRFMGPGGGGQCGTDCEAYCELFPKACPDDAYPTADSCLKACKGLTDQESFSVTGDYTGDSIECRLVHLSSATLKPEEHCSHAPIPPSGPRCTGAPDAAPSCDEYCKIQLAACDGPLTTQYETEQQCLDVCAALPPGDNADKTDNTVGCRRYHAFSATLAAEQHCSHSGPTGDGHCGDTSKVTTGHTGNCDSYCTLLAEACPSEFASEMVDTEQCMAKCVQLPDAEPDSKYSLTNAGESTGLSCRILHTARAFADEAACASAIGAAPCAP